MLFVKSMVPYSQVDHQMTKGKLESTQSKMTNCSTDLAFGSDNEFVELLWENGPIVMQGQSSRTRKSSLSTTFSPPSHKVQEKDNSDNVIPKMGRYGNLDSVVNDFSLPVPSGHVGVEQDDEMAPWLNCHIDDSLQNDYCSDYFAELSRTDLNSLTLRNNPQPANKNSSFCQAFRGSFVDYVDGNSNLDHGNAPKVDVKCSEPTRFRSSPFSASLHQYQPSATNQKKVSDFISNNSNSTNHQSRCENPNQLPSSAAWMLDKRMQKKDSPSGKPPQPNNNMVLMNFSHFSRPAALVKANLQSIGATAAGSSGVDRLRSADKGSITNSTPIEPSVVESTSGLKGISMVHEIHSKSSCKLLQEPVSVNRSEAICHEDSSRNNGTRTPDHIHCESSSFAASVAVGRLEGEKASNPPGASTSEGEKAAGPVVASSSVCSGNSTGGLSNDMKHNMKRKSREAEESGYQSEDVEDESMDVKKKAKGPKRSRAAEVHNLSERRRRDRINEKMRALQELIPNCNKVDKASMLDEAIEYLKTLQLQVQIMSMGSGFCMPSMMLPAGLQQIRASHMPHFPPMGTGMGMGLGMGVGYGMGMIDMSCSSGYPLIPVPPMHGAQFPYSPIAGAAGLHGMPGSGVQMFGIPGQGVPLPLPRAQYIPMSGFSTRVVSAPDAPMVACPPLVPDSSLPSSSKDQIHDTNLQPMNKKSNNCSQIQTSTQVTEECFEQSDLVHRNNQSSQAKTDAPAADTVVKNEVARRDATRCDRSKIS